MRDALRSLSRLYTPLPEATVADEPQCVYRSNLSGYSQADLRWFFNPTVFVLCGKYKRKRTECGLNSRQDWRLAVQFVNQASYSPANTAVSRTSGGCDKAKFNMLVTIMISLTILKCTHAGDMLAKAVTLVCSGGVFRSCQLSYWWKCVVMATSTLNSTGSFVRSSPPPFGICDQRQQAMFYSAFQPMWYLVVYPLCKVNLLAVSSRAAVRVVLCCVLYRVSCIAGQKPIEKPRFLGTRLPSPG